MGGGLAGRLAASRLARHADVLLIDDKGAPAPATVRSLGIAARGGSDSPWRLAQALGEARAADLWRWSARAVDELRVAAKGVGVEIPAPGSVRLSLDEAERQEWEASFPLIRAWFGEGCAEAVDPAGFGERFDGAVRVAGDGVVDVAALAEALGEGLATAEGPARVLASTGDGVRLAVGEADLTAELVVVAAGPGAPAVHPWFAPMVYPVRLQGLRTAPLAWRSPLPALARHRFEAWLTEPSGALAFVGCRWAEQPEMEAGVTDDATTSARVEAGQREFLAAHLPGAAGAEVDRTWGGIEAWSCDGLPIVGPLPGNPRVLSLVGWSGWGLSWIGAAVADVCDAAVGLPDAGTVPPEVAARRLL